MIIVYYMILIKNSITRGTWELSKNSFAMRSLLRGVGVRTPQGFYVGKAGSMRLPDGSVLILTHLDQNYLSYELHWKGWRYYEPLYLLLLREVLQDCEVFYDVGGNMGYYTLSAAKFRPGLAIHTFEPNPKMHAILAANLAANGIGQVVLNQLALSDHEGLVDFYLPASDLSGTLDPDFNAAEQVTVQQVRATTIDAYAGLQPIAGRLLMKIDVEGHEPEVLVGATETIREHRPDIIMEVTHDYGRDLLGFLSGLGYGIYELTPEGFERTDRLEVHQEGEHFFLNRFITTRSQNELDALYARIRGQWRSFHLQGTNLTQRGEG